MYLNFSNFRGRTSAGGGDKPWSKNGDKCQMGGLAKFSPDGGDPPSPLPPPPPQEKNPVCDNCSARYPVSTTQSNSIKSMHAGNLNCTLQQKFLFYYFNNAMQFFPWGGGGSSNNNTTHLTLVSLFGINLVHPTNCDLSPKIGSKIYIAVLDCWMHTFLSVIQQMFFIVSTLIAGFEF